MTGWRIGYEAGPAPLICGMVAMQSQSKANPCSISQWAALEALAGPRDHFPQAAAEARRHGDRFGRSLPRHVARRGRRGGRLRRRPSASNRISASATPPTTTCWPKPACASAVCATLA
jgi:hypothetical protein